MDRISPKYKIHLIERLSDALWGSFKTYSKVYAYINQWHILENYNNFDYYENFEFEYKDKERSQIDVFRTLSNMDGELVLKIAIDMGLETPDYIPSIPTFRNEIKEHYHNASEVFEKAYSQVEDDPSLAIGLANSALESIVKDVCISLGIEGYKEHATLTELIKIVMKHFRDSNSDYPDEIKVIANNLYNASKSIEDIRSDKTSFHGKSSRCKIINNSSYAYFIVNSVATIGLFLINYQKEFVGQDDSDILDLPF